MTLREQAYNKIREEILRRNLAHDRLTSEREIAEEHVHMSRTPVREALAVLLATGVLEQTPQVGVKVRRINGDQALRTIRLRLGMEPVMVEEITSLSNVNLSELNEAAAAAVAAYEQDDPIAFMLADTCLHTGLARAGGFTTSITGLQGLRDEVHLFRLDNPITSAEMSDVLQEHADLLEALEAHDRKRAEDAVIAHLEATHARIDGAEAGELVREDELEMSGR
jgi:DNA-binding GntR family transcriptional regulator